MIFFNGQPADAQNVSVKNLDNGGLNDLEMDANDALIVSAEPLERNYTIIYSMCENTQSSNCSNAAATFSVGPNLSTEKFFTLNAFFIRIQPQLWSILKFQRYWRVLRNYNFLIRGRKILSKSIQNP